MKLFRPRSLSALAGLALVGGALLLAPAVEARRAAPAGRDRAPARRLMDARFSGLPDALKLAPGQAAQPMCKTFFALLVTPSIEGEISARPGSYTISVPLLVRLVSSEPGWWMKLDATHLKIENQTPVEHIRAQEVFAMVGGGDPIPLATPVRIVEGGPAGETLLEITLVLITDKFHRPGVYRGEIRVHPANPAGQEWQMLKIPFTVTVQARVEHSIAGQKVYFHFGKPGESQTASISGRVRADMPMALVLSVPEGRLDAMPRVKAMGDASQADGVSIPVVWKLKEQGAGQPRVPDSVSHTGGMASWLMDETPGEVEYRVECTVSPSSYQPPGDYAYEVEVNLVPVF